MRPSTSTVLALVLVAGGASFVAPPAHAQPADPQLAAVAQALYEQAVPAMRSGDFAAACPKLEQVVELAPTGVGAKIMLAECYEGLHRLASAWSMYAVVEGAAAAANQPERRQKAHERAAALKPRLAVLTVVVPAAVQAIPGIEIRRDGLLTKSLEWGLALPADAGKHVVAASAPGRLRWEHAVEVPQDGATVSITVEAPATEDAAPAPAQASTWTGRRTAGVVVGGVGLLGIGLGSFFGVTAIQKKNLSNQGHCQPDDHCDTMGLALRDQGLTAAAASTGLVIGGLVALAGGVTLVALPTSASGPQSVGLSIGPGRLGMRGTW